MLNLINYDGNVAQRKLGACSVQLDRVRQLKYTFFMLLSVCIELNSPCVCTCNHLCVCQTGELVVSPVTDDNQKAFKDLTTVGLLQQELQ